VVEVVWRTVCAGLLGIGALMVCDVFYARHTQARWFALHVIANAWISLLCLPDLIYIFAHPVEALSQRHSTNHWPTSLVFSVHLYHMLFFRNLQWIDWLHHVLMVVIGAPLLITGELGPLMNFNHFFMCGVPGGADYAMLFAVKHGWMAPLTEKRYNSAINVWVREPALVAVGTLGYVQMHLQPSVFSVPIYSVRVFLILLALWNGLFFMERVVGNYHVCAYKEKQARRNSVDKGGGSNGNGTLDGESRPSQGDVYESEEHFSTSLPGVGMRVSVSTAELMQLGLKQPGADADPNEAYPIGAASGKAKEQ